MPVSSRRMALDEDSPASVVPAVAVLAAAGAVPVAAGRGGAGLAVAWVASVAVVIGAVVLLVVGRETVMQVWAPSVRAYAALGLASRP